MAKTQHNRRLFALLLAFVAAEPTMLAAPSATAQVITFDPNNYAQNILTAARSLQQINNQITMLEHQEQALTNQAKNLANLPVSTLAQLQQNIGQTQQLLAKAQNIAFSVQAVDQAFQSTYGSGAVSITASDKALVSQAQTRWQTTVGGLQDAMRVQATVVGNLSTAQAQTTTLVSASQSASGALAATQAGNQLLALQSQQLADLTSLIAANGRAQALKDADAATAAAQGQEQRRRFMQSSTTYQPGNAQMFYGN
jgi:P-type conjugative transfer protein TrbJ